MYHDVLPIEWSAELRVSELRRCADRERLASQVALAQHSHQRTQGRPTRLGGWLRRLVWRGRLATPVEAPRGA